MRHVTSSAMQLRSGEAVELAHAWVQQLARSLGIPLLIVKGPSLHRLGLRGQRASSDVDVLLPPGEVEAMCSALRGAGWTERDNGALMSHVGLHSRTFISQTWPCDIDVHWHFPGFLTDPDSVFSALWARRTTIEFAGVPCAVVDRMGGALILALHSLRSTSEQQRHDAELDELIQAPFTVLERKELGGLAAATGSVEALDAVLPQLGVYLRSSDVAIDLVALREWRQRTAVRDFGLGTYDLLHAFRESPLHRKPAILWRAVWPSENDLRFLRPGLPDDPKVRNAARRDRLTKGIRALPQVLRSVWRNGR